MDSKSIEFPKGRANPTSFVVGKDISGKHRLYHANDIHSQILQDDQEHSISLSQTESGNGKSSIAAHENDRFTWALKGDGLNHQKKTHVHDYSHNQGNVYLSVEVHEKNAKKQCERQQELNREKYRMNAGGERHTLICSEDKTHESKRNLMNLQTSPERKSKEHQRLPKSKYTEMRQNIQELPTTDTKRHGRNQKLDQDKERKCVDDVQSRHTQKPSHCSRSKWQAVNSIMKAVAPINGIVCSSCKSTLDASSCIEESQPSLGNRKLSFVRSEGSLVLVKEKNSLQLCQYSPEVRGNINYATLSGSSHSEQISKQNNHLKESKTRFLSLQPESRPMSPKTIVNVSSPTKEKNFSIPPSNKDNYHENYRIVRTGHVESSPQSLHHRNSFIEFPVQKKRRESVKTHGEDISQDNRHQKFRIIRTGYAEPRQQSPNHKNSGINMTLDRERRASEKKHNEDITKDNRYQKFQMIRTGYIDSKPQSMDKTKSVIKVPIQKERMESAKNRDVDLAKGNHHQNYRILRTDHSESKPQSMHQKNSGNESQKGRELMKSTKTHGGPKDMKARITRKDEEPELSSAVPEERKGRQKPTRWVSTREPTKPSMITRSGYKIETNEDAVDHEISVLEDSIEKERSVWAKKLKQSKDAKERMAMVQKEPETKRDAVDKSSGRFSMTRTQAEVPRDEGTIVEAPKVNWIYSREPERSRSRSNSANSERSSDGRIYTSGRNSSKTTSNNDNTDEQKGMFYYAEGGERNHVSETDKHVRHNKQKTSEDSSSTQLQENDVTVGKDQTKTLSSPSDVVAKADVVVKPDGLEKRQPLSNSNSSETLPDEGTVPSHKASTPKEQNKRKQNNKRKVSVMKLSPDPKHTSELVRKDFKKTDDQHVPSSGETIQKTNEPSAKKQRPSSDEVAEKDYVQKPTVETPGHDNVDGSIKSLEHKNHSPKTEENDASTINKNDIEETSEQMKQLSEATNEDGNKISKKPGSSRRSVKNVERKKNEHLPNPSERGYHLNKSNREKRIKPVYDPPGDSLFIKMLGGVKEFMGTTLKNIESIDGFGTIEVCEEGTSVDKEANEELTITHVPIDLKTVKTSESEKFVLDEVSNDLQRSIAAEQKPNSNRKDDILSAVQSSVENLKLEK